MRTAVTIAGSDSSGGAGIQADIKTMMANGVYAMSAITALTAQNTTGVTSILNATPEFLGQELDAIFTDIYPDAVKIGMVSESGLIRTHRGKAPPVRGEKHRGGSRHGGHQRRETHQRGGSGDPEKGAFSSGLRPDTEHSRGRSPHRDGSRRPQRI